MEICMDPIVVFYESMLKKTQADLKLPEFSEIYLRLALKIILGKDYRVDLNLIPLRKQVNVIWLSKVITDVVLLEHESGISQAYISYILTHEKEILNRWLNASSCSKNKETYKKQKEKYECDLLDQILFEWTKRKMLNFKRTVYPYEIELQAEVIRQQLNISKYTIGLHIWNSDYTYTLRSSKLLDQSLSLDTADILHDICQEVHLPTYTKFKNMLNKLDHVQPTVPRKSGLNATLDQLSPASIETKDETECIDISCEAERTSDNEVRHGDETKAVNIGQPETKKEGSEVNVMPKTEEPEKGCEKTSYTRNENKEVITLQDNERHKCSFIQDENTSMYESAAEEVIRQEVLDILAEIEEEIQAEESRSSPVTVDSSVGSTKDIPLISKILDADGGNLQNGSAHPLQNEKSLILLPTDSIQELVQKYEIYRSQQQSIRVSKSLFGYQEIPANYFMEIDEMRNKVLNGDVSGTMDKSDTFSSRLETIENSNSDLTEVAIEQKVKEEKTMDVNSSEHQANVQTFTKFESYQKNQLEQGIQENGTPFESVISEDITNLGIKKKESNLFAENIYDIEEYNSDIAYKKAHDDSEHVSPSKKNQTTGGIEMLMNPMRLKDIAAKLVNKLKQSNFRGYDQLIETISDDDDLYETIRNGKLFNCNNNVNGMTQSYTTTIYEIVPAASHKRKNPATLNTYKRKRICMESEPTNKSHFENHIFHNDKRFLPHLQKDNDKIQNVEDCSYGENGSSEHVILVEIVSDEEDDIKLLKAPEMKTHMIVSESGMGNSRPHCNGATIVLS